MPVHVYVCMCVHACVCVLGRAASWFLLWGVLDVVDYDEVGCAAGKLCNGVDRLLFHGIQDHQQYSWFELRKGNNIIIYIDQLRGPTAKFYGLGQI